MSDVSQDRKMARPGVDVPAPIDPLGQRETFVRGKNQAGLDNLPVNDATVKPCPSCGQDCWRYKLDVAIARNNDDTRFGPWICACGWKEGDNQLHALREEIRQLQEGLRNWERENSRILQEIDRLYIENNDLRLKISNYRDPQVERLMAEKTPDYSVWDATYRMALDKISRIEAEVWRLREELETTVNKLSDLWIHLDAYARGVNVPVVGQSFSPAMAAAILGKQQAPGWKAVQRG